MEPRSNDSSPQNQASGLDPTSAPYPGEEHRSDGGVSFPICQDTATHTFSEVIGASDPALYPPQTTIDPSFLFAFGETVPNDCMQGGQPTSFPSDIPLYSEPFQAWPAQNSAFAVTQNPSSSDTFLRTCLELSNSQVQSLMSRVQDLEASLRASEKKIDEFSDWSKKMERHSQESSSIVLSLLDTFKKSEYLRSTSQDPNDGMPARVFLPPLPSSC